MDRELRDKIRQATESSDVEKSDFIELLRLVDRHYEQMEATITQSLTASTPIESVFDSVTEALMSVSETGTIRICNKVCAKYFGLTRDQLIGSQIEHVLPGARDVELAGCWKPVISDPDATHPERTSGDFEAGGADGEKFVAVGKVDRTRRRPHVTFVPPLFRRFVLVPGWRIRLVVDRLHLMRRLVLQPTRGDFLGEGIRIG